MGILIVLLLRHISALLLKNDLLLLGDTLRSIHPVAGQGWNLGVKDITTFVNLLDQYSIDDPNLYKFYYARRRVDSFAYLSFTSLLNSFMKMKIILISSY